jgi:uncharacterized protein
VGRDVTVAIGPRLITRPQSVVPGRSHRAGARGARWAAVWLLSCSLLAGTACGVASAQAADAPLPVLTEPVTDLARVIDPGSAEEMDRVIRALKAASGDVVVVVTVPTIAPYADVREYALKLFENGGRGIGDKGKDNGLLILLAVQERGVWVEVGYGLEPYITDGFAGETSRQYMVPAFRGGRYGPGLLAGTQRIVGRIAQGRNVQLTGVEIPPERTRGTPQFSVSWVVLLFIIIALLSRMGGGGPRRGVRRWGQGGWSGWSSGVGPFGGGFGGGGFGGGGGGFGGGFGGFGGGRSGGGGGGGSW